MIDKKPRRTMTFAEQDEDFIKKLAGDVGCHYSKANERTYNLKKRNSDNQVNTGIFAWVHKEENDYFWVATRKIWVEQARAKAISGRNRSRPGCFSRDTQHAEDSVCFDTKDDYQKAVRALSMINNMR
ncbi:MAG: hypothetical protein JXA17_00080 [Dehalococcoidales bacterium]|nr:hypothetical protein [Dehalococcoidales bacterium]